LKFFAPFASLPGGRQVGGEKDLFAVESWNCLRNQKPGVWQMSMLGNGNITLPVGIIGLGLQDVKSSTGFSSCVNTTQGHARNQRLKYNHPTNHLGSGGRAA
jgi:hypothetical protein